VQIFRELPAFRTLWEDIGQDLPWVSQSFLMIYQYTPLVPILTLALAIDILRRKDASPWYSGAVLFGALAAGFTLDTWSSEAKWSLLFMILKNIGML
jgi:hypothetical protein